MIRGLVEDYYDIQKMRLEVQNQQRAYRQGVSESEDAWMKENVTDKLSGIEKTVGKRLSTWVKDESIYDYWLKDIQGIGPVLASGLIAWISDIKKFETISKLWAYAGLSVDEDGRARRRKAGEKSNWNSRLKVLCWKIGESFVKTGAGYRELYDQFREEYDGKWKTFEDCGSIGCKNAKKCMDGHRYAAAKRKVVKVFLAHLWMQWRKMEGLPVEHPFIIGKGKHEHLIAPLKK